jgi:fructose-1,6-bisphosphatase I
MPKRGQVYSLNDARYFDWPPGLRAYIDTIRQGKGQNPKQYSARYICSLGGLGRSRVEPVRVGARACA